MKLNLSRVGALVLFKDGVTEDQAHAALEKIKDVLRHIDLNTYDPEHECPVWYIP